MSARDSRGERSAVERSWRGDSGAGALLLFALVPAAGAFRAVVAIRNSFWKFFRRRAGVPVISIGNLTVGGNAKTPFTVFLANLLAGRGMRVAIVSRGYGAQIRRGRAALAADKGELQIPVEEAGDEAAMMARSFAGPIAVARRRIDAIELLKARGPLDAIILDDGFQHARLARDVDLVMIGRERGLGNGWMLPAGPMREPLRAIRRADAAVIVANEAAASAGLSNRQLKIIGAIKNLHATVRPRALVTPDKSGWRETPLPLAGRRVIALSGLAHPAGFYAMLRALEADLVGVLEYPDHHAYSTADRQAILSAAREADLIVTTEKDLIKLERFSFARDSIFALRIEIAMDADNQAALLELIDSRIARASSS